MNKKLLQYIFLIICLIIVILIGDFLKYLLFILIGTPTYIIFKKGIYDKLTLKGKWKIIQAFQIIGFTFLVIWSFIYRYIPELINSIILYISIMGILLSIPLRQELPKDKLLNGTLEQKITNDLKIKTKTYKKKFPKFLNKIGGFVMPAIPFIIFVNKDWKKKLDKEAIIHENIHLYYLQNGAILVFLAGFSLVHLILSFLFKSIYDHKSILYLILFFYVLSMSIYFEYITFNKTNEMASKYKIETRKWDKKICFKYLYLYTLQFFIIFAIYFGIKYLIKVII